MAAQLSALTRDATMDELVISENYGREGAEEVEGRGLHSSTPQLNVSAFCVLHASASRLDVSTACGLCWVLHGQKRLRLS